jgi:DNA topoisomerase IA
LQKNSLANGLRERLKEAKGIGTPATRAEIIKGLKRQNLLAADGKLVLPTPAGLQLFELLRGAHSLIPGQQHYGRCIWTKLSLGERTFGR